jgi:hypothetical protein
LGRGISGGSPKNPSGGALCALVPPGGVGGPKKRHLVLYKLAGFSPADRKACGAFFPCIAPRCFSKFSKKCKNWTPLTRTAEGKSHFNPILGRFLHFFRQNCAGGATPFLGVPRGGSPGGSRGGAWAELPLSGVPKGTPGGWGKKTLFFWVKFFPKKNLN